MGDKKVFSYSAVKDGKLLAVTANVGDEDMANLIRDLIMEGADIIPHYSREEYLDFLRNFKGFKE